MVVFRWPFVERRRWWGARDSASAHVVGSVRRCSFDSGAVRSAVRRRSFWPEHDGGERCCNRQRGTSSVREHVLSRSCDGPWSTACGGCWAGTRRLQVRCGRRRWLQRWWLARQRSCWLVWWYSAVAIQCVLRKFLAATC